MQSLAFSLHLNLLSIQPEANRICKEAVLTLLQLCPDYKQKTGVLQSLLQYAGFYG